MSHAGHQPPLAALHRLRGHERLLCLHRTTGQPRIPRQTHRRHQRQNRHLHHHLLLRGPGARHPHHHAAEQARALCPEFIQVPARPERYAEVSTASCTRCWISRRTWRYFRWTRRFSISPAARPTGTNPRHDGEDDQGAGMGRVRTALLGGAERGQDHGQVRRQAAQAGRPHHYSPLGGPRAG